jgi:hypothetical protein
MATPERTELINDAGDSFVLTGNDPDVTITARDIEHERARWQRCIDEKLIEWGRDPSQLEDDGVDAPSPDVIRLAIEVASRYRDSGQWAPPDRVAPDPNGGIVFERRAGSQAEVLHVGSDGEVEYQRFVGPRLVERRRLLAPRSIRGA